ncbi:MAG: hypothetical protein P8J33_04310, partial [Pirellulaceae bacterium]|nr:hypothetical protein [Pirellulaceae bacterium]
PKMEITKVEFTDGDKQWQMTDPQAWEIKDAKLSLFQKKSHYQPEVRSPRHIAWLKDMPLKDFQLDVEILSTEKDYNHRDACLFFGFQSPTQFYYVHLGKKADPHANQIFIVDNAARKKISLTTTAGTPWDDQWHHVRLIRNLESGSIEVYFDDMQKPVMTAKDKSFAQGWIGLGSFDDTADFRNLTIQH